LIFNTDTFKTSNFSKEDVTNYLIEYQKTYASYTLAWINEHLLPYESPQDVAIAVKEVLDGGKDIATLFDIQISIDKNVLPIKYDFKGIYNNSIYTSIFRIYVKDGS